MSLHRPRLGPSSGTRAPATRGVLAALLSASLLSASLFACERDPRFDLFEVSELSGDRLDAGRVLSVRGSGFPVGRQVQVLFEGVLYGPLATRRRTSHRITGRTVTPERVELTPSDTDIQQIGGRGTFEGAVEIVVPGAAIEGRRAHVVGRLEDVVLDVVPSERRPRAPRAGVSLAEVLGVSLQARSVDLDTDEAGLEDDDSVEGDESSADALPDLPGVLVRDASPEGPAARLGLAAAGLAPGARIIAIDGFRVLDASELRLDPLASTCVLTLAVAHDREANLAIDVDAALGRRRTSSFRYDQLAAVVLVAAALFGAWPRPRTRSSASDGADGRPLAAFVTGLLALVIALTAAVLIPGAELSFPAWLGTALFVRASAALALGPDASDGAHAQRGLLAAIRAAWRSAIERESFVALASAVAATVAIAVFVTVAGSAGGAALPILGGPLARAPWMPMAWPLVRSAFGPFALAALLAAGAASTRPIAHPSSRRARLLRGLDDLGLAMLATAFVRVAIADPGSRELAVRATGLVASVALYGGLLRVRAWGAALGALARAAVASIAAAATLTGAALWLELAPEPAVEQAAAEVVMLALGLLVVRVALGPTSSAEGGGGSPGIPQHPAR